MEPKERKVAIYGRVANADEFAMKAQKSRLCRYAAENGYQDPDFYMDNGYSGLNYDRPAFRRLEDDIGGGRVDAVIVCDISRIGRNVLATAQWIDRLRGRGIAFIQADLSLCDNYLQNRVCFK